VSNHFVYRIDHVECIAIIHHTFSESQNKLLVLDDILGTHHPIRRALDLLRLDVILNSLNLVALVLLQLDCCFS
jgi:hypothetical protein